MLMNFLRKWIRHLIFGHSSTQMLFKGLKPAIKQQFPAEISQIIKNIKSKAREIIQQHQDSVIDGASRGHVEFSSHILAAYYVLLSKFANDKVQTVEFLKKATMAGYDTWMLRFAFRMILGICRNNPKKLESIFAWMMKQYGASFNWKYSDEDLDHHHDSVLVIHRCFYVEFFKMHDAIFLTPILCQLDAIWFEMINPQKHGFRFNKEHYQTQGYGAHECRFPIDRIQS